MRILSQTLTIIGLCVGAFALAGLHSHREYGGFLGLDLIFLQIDLLIGIFVLVAGLAMMLCFTVRDRVIERAARRDADTAGGPPPLEDIPLCYSCLTPAKPHQHFCMKCWTPLTSHAEIDPLGRVYAMGDMYWKLTRGPSKPIAVVGFLLIFAPLLIVQVIGAVAFVVGAFSHRAYFPLFRFVTTLDGVLMLLGGLLYLATMFVQGMVLVRVIQNYSHPDWREKLRSECRPEKDAESIPDDSGDHRNPPSGLKELRETRDK